MNDKFSKLLLLKFKALLRVYLGDKFPMLIILSLVCCALAGIRSFLLFVLELRDLAEGYILAHCAADLDFHVFIELLVQVAPVCEYNYEVNHEENEYDQEHSSVGQAI